MSRRATFWQAAKELVGVLLVLAFVAGLCFIPFACVGCVARAVKWGWSG